MSLSAFSAVEVVAITRAPKTRANCSAKTDHDGSLMSIALRSPSLSRLKHSEVMTIADRRPLPANGVDDDFRRFFSQLLCEAVA